MRIEAHALQTIHGLAVEGCRPARRVAALSQAMCLANDRCWSGAFVLWRDQKLMGYRYSLNLAGGAHATTAQINDMVRAAVSACERFYPAFQLVTWGGDTPEGGFDCSGLVNYVYRDMLDLRLPRTSRQLAAWQGPRIAPERLAPADLVFFGSDGDVSHVGIYVGEGRFVHAPNTGGTVRLDRLDGSWWRDHYTGARRVLGAKSPG